MIVENGHAHAYTRGELLEWKDYVLLLRSVIESKTGGNKSLTVHLPYEIQHAEVRDVKRGEFYISYGEVLKRNFSIKLYWENAPWLEHRNWSLKYDNTDWTYVPRTIDLCLDTGHLMLGCKNRDEFLSLLDMLIKDRGSQIKFLHLHENNFRSDDHDPVPGIVLTKSVMNWLIKDRDFIIEKPWS
ncbi:hypothetical protein A2686_05185 [Candidatus Woesebacteria bacterium RIFCSPHIGHO2_01_FULL_38_10]|uniref:Xylose isomerase-like TIM barrel domain-containing protein n=1 Tax=Candidatus Woesebacteria bacterium RIFCSPLOWO2_01_FULL_39_10b TaxID=1802517 RepID=A0A1F8B6G9_9BACT|nr:MAG: hypothetical protein A2686_05185 [Candidatus Woesebacteria bacterium RIFCSPHIGHO2_01_FULL_38_10]OGM59510.1 MAG: hypothetical protein A2892_02625 [Candidatus Woesebacteria bacterium RIFCSPLOWO2_01_FULL_39_10b]